MKAAAIAALAALAVAPACAMGYPADTIITTDAGQVGGQHTQGAKEWLGIPIGEDTSGTNRFMPPVKRQPWQGVFNATEWGPGCAQTHHNKDVPAVVSEDCLNANVWAPMGTNSSSMLPVMIFWHGGSFAEGSDQGPFYLYRGAYIAANKPVIVVSANYRLGALGWLVTDTVKGNLGLLDQRNSLEWVQRNIKAFGGDPSRVTLWGESAGAMSVGLHLTMTGSKGLFHQAIMESNVAGYRYRTPDQAQMYGNAFCALLNCSLSGSTCNTTCIQSATWQQVGWAWNKAADNIGAIVLGNWNHWLEAVLSWDPVIDGTLLEMEPLAALKAGKWDTSVSILAGTNQDEGATFVYAGIKFALPTFIMEWAFDGIFGSNGDRVQQMYANVTNSSWSDGRDLMSEVITDYWFRCATENFAVSVADAGTAAYLYRYDHVYSDSQIFAEFGIPTVCENRTCHASELIMAFHNTVPSLNATFTPAEVGLADSFVDYWTSFVQFGDPNVGNNQKVTWPKFDSASRTNLVLNVDITTESAYDLCNDWDEIGYNH